MGRVAHFRFSVLAGTVLLVAGWMTPARAQDPDDLKRGVARISLMNGDVNVRRGDSGEWVAGVINAPLLTDDRIATGQNSRTEVQFDSANILRMGGNAEIRLSQLEAGRYQMELARGTVTFRVLRPSNANVEVDTPSVSVRPSKIGIYRITVNDAGESEITARTGEVEVFTPRGSQWVSTGQTMVARGTTADPEFQMVNAIPVDDWDRWNDSRDRVLSQSPGYQYVGPGIYGVEDLDAYGTWTDVPQYGPVWRPTAVGPGWAPYQSGRWVWEDWYGWTWVSYDPWGWAPYHYGRWFWDTGYGWCWYPGVFGVRHYWSPALVAFFGFGHGVGFGFGFGNIGWVPLAPFEVFHPWWGRGYYGGGFGRGFNVTNVNITNVYRNARVVNGISAVGAADFRSGRFNSVMRPGANEVREAGLVRGQMPISPTSANLHFSNRVAANVPHSSENTRFFTHQQPSPAQRVPFSQQQRAMAGGGNDRPGSSGVSGWSRFGSPSGQGFNPSSGGSSGRAAENSRSQSPSAGWNRFGEPGSSSRQNSLAQRSQGNSGGTYNAPRYNAPSNSRPSAPSYNAPRSGGSGGSYSPPRSSGGGGGHPSGGSSGHSGGSSGGSRGHR